MVSLKQHEVDASEIVDALGEIAARIPHFVQLSPEKILAMRRAATLDPNWVIEAVAAVGASPTVEGVIGNTSGELLEELNDMSRWHDVESQLLSMLRGVRGANLVRRHRIGVKVLQAYGVIRHLIRQPEHQSLRPFFDKLQQMNRLGKRKKPAPDDPLTE